MTAASIASSFRTLLLRRRDDLKARATSYRGEAYWTVKDPVALSYFQLREEEYFLLMQLDGTVSLEDLRQRYNQRFAPNLLTVVQIQAFLGMLHEEGLIISSHAGQGAQLLQQHSKQRRDQRLQRFANPLAIRFRGINAEPILSFIYPYCRWIFSAWFVTTCILFVLATIAGAVWQQDVLFGQVNWNTTFINSRNVLILMLAIGITKILHELGHGLTCRHFGGRCHEIGAMLLVGSPCLYCNVSDAWMLPSKWQRISISGAGIAVEMVLGCLAVWGYWTVEAGLVKSLCLAIAGICTLNTLLINGNPLLRYDGYYVLADLIEVPNLWQQSRRLIRQKAALWLAGLELPEARLLPSHGRVSLHIYGLASMAYRLFVLAAILWMLNRWLAPISLGPLVHLLAALMVAGIVISPVVGAYRLFSSPSTKDNWNPRWLAISLPLAFLVLAMLVLVPLPRWVTAPGVTRHADAQTIFVEVSGTLRSCVKAGDEVRAGNVIAKMDRIDLARQTAQLRGKRDEQAVHLTNLRSARVFEDQDGVQSAAQRLPIAEEMLVDLRRQVQQSESELARLTLLAPTDGIVMPVGQRPISIAAGELPNWEGSPLDAHNRGAFLESGTKLCVLGSPNKWKMVVVLQQSDVNRVRVGHRARIRLDPFANREFTGSVTGLAEMNLAEAPRELVASGDVATESNARGDSELRETLYQATVTLDHDGLPLLTGACGRARISVASETIMRRAENWFLGLFRTNATR